jgi:hypothetical protein
MCDCDYENVCRDCDEDARAMQPFINNGSAWRLEGAIGRRAMDLIEAGLCCLPQVDHVDFYGNLVPSRDRLEPGTKGTVGYCRDRYPDRAPWRIA